jgi:MFS family permease
VVLWRRTLVSGRVAVATLFFVNGATFGSWAGRVPAVSDAVGLSSGQLGVALACWSAAAITALPLAGALVAWGGSRKVVLGSLLAFTAALVLLPLASNVWVFAGFLAIFGAANSGVDVATNAQSVHVEHAYRRPLLSGFHALFSAGTMTGALCGSLAAGMGVGVITHFAVAAVALLGLGCLVLPAVPEDPPGTGQGPVFAWPGRALLLPGLVLFCSAAMEDIAASWSAVYLRNAAEAGPGLAAAGFALISASMIAGRLVGDHARTRLGVRRFVRASGCLALLGGLIAVLFPHPLPVAIGFVLLGLGLAGLFPAMLSHVGQRHRTNIGQAIAAVSTVGYLGSLAGPSVVGGIADHFGLRIGLALLTIFATTVVVLAGRFNHPSNS